MKYIPQLIVWELTNACNAKCLHCGSQSGFCRDNELTEEEALDLCDQLKEVGAAHVTLIGGEMFLSPYWDKVCQRLVDHGIRVAPFTNGILLNRPNIQRLQDIGIKKAQVSIDGIGDTHNHLRGVPNLFNRVIENIKLAQAAGLRIGVTTSVSTLNLNELPAMFDFFSELGIAVWQIQLVENIGSAAKNSDLALPIEGVYNLAQYIADFRQRHGQMKILTGDNIGFFVSFEPVIRDEPFLGCGGGRCLLGISANGNIRGCLSVQDSPENTEGNIRERSLNEIWNDPNCFTVYREKRLEILTGFCATCEYREYCRGGCSSLAFATTGGFSENPFCLHKYECEHPTLCSTVPDDAQQ